MMKMMMMIMMMMMSMIMMMMMMVVVVMKMLMMMVMVIVVVNTCNKSSIHIDLIDSILITYSVELDTYLNPNPKSYYD